MFGVKPGEIEAFTLQDQQGTLEKQFGKVSKQTQV